ncbi:MAG: cytochrome c family protein [Rhodospirillaceae bacterium]|nr:cytochrome c family protein [Rhodospirillaceae bacterium]
MQVAQNDSGDAALAGDPDAGKNVFNKCRACHKVEQGAGNGVGPNLHGVYGREAGAAEGFNYSKAMKNADIVWNADTLSQYLEAPRKFIPGNKMAFPGLRSEDDRQNVIAYLHQQSE